MIQKFVIYSLMLIIVSICSNVFAFSSKKSSDEGDISSVWISKADGAKSCSVTQGESVEKGAEELKKANIRVLDSTKGKDGKFHAQMCGLPAGTVNAYQISKSDLNKAIALGFEEAKKNFK